MPDNKLDGTVGLNTTDFKTCMAGMNRELRVLESGFRASSAGLGDWAKDASGLELRIKSLSGQIEIQKGKVAAVRAEYERVAAEKGANSRAAQDLQIKLNKENESLGKMQVELSGTETKLGDLKSGSEGAGRSAQEMGEKVEKSGSKVEAFKKILGGVGAVAKATVVGIAAVGGAAIAAVGALAGLALKGAKTADELIDLSNQTGIGTTRLQEMKYAGELMGTELETMTGAQAKLIRSMASAQEQQAKFDEQLASGKMEDEINVPIEMAAAFNGLGVSFVDASGKLRNNQDVFADTIDALGKIENPTERDALAMEIFGKSAQELNPLIVAGSAEMARLSEEAHKMGAVMSEEDVAAGGALKDQLDSLKMGFEGVLVKVGGAFMPMISGLAGQAQGYLQELVGVVQGSGGDIGKMAEGMGEIVGKIATELVAQLPKLMTVGVSILQSILTAIIAALPTLITAAVGIVTTLLGFLVQNLPKIMQAGVQLLLTLVKAIIGALPSLIGAAFQMIITLVQGIAAALPELIPAIVEMLVLIITTIVDNIPLLLDAALQLIMGLVQGITAALPVLIAAVPKILTSIIDALTEMLPMLVEMAPKIIVALITGIISALPALAKAIPQIIEAIIRVLTELLPDILEAGVEILKGIWNGIASQLPWFWAQIKQFALDIWKNIKKVLGIESPSKLFADSVGPFIPLGIWEGIERQMPDLKSKLAEAMRGLAGTLNINATGLAAPAYATSGGIYGMAPITVNVQASVASAIDIETMAYRIASVIQRRR